VSRDFDQWFKEATRSKRTPDGTPPLPYQRELATAEALPRLLRIPTGLGKTQAILGAWLWRRRFADNSVRAATPRRLVYCLPMRVLVEQSHDVARAMLERGGLADRVGLHVLMGGEVGGDWDLHPEGDTILIGTQDLLLSRALNRGYAMGRYRWPMHFALLNNDALWVIDEPQLFGAGLPTTTQLTAFRRRFGTFGPTATIWASATLEPAWLRTVDVVPAHELMPELELSDGDRRLPIVQKRLGAPKTVFRADATIGDDVALCNLVLREHRTGTRTIVVVNTVKRARDLHALLVAGGPTTKGKAKGRKKACDESPPLIERPRIVLIHSRFRPDERRARVEEALADPIGPGTIVVSTQVIEAGVDVSAKTLVTDVAPWASVVQRLGRCNRSGDDGPDARVFWCGLPTKAKHRKGAAAPYDLAEVERAEDALGRLPNGSPEAILALAVKLDDPPPTQVIRARDLVELFDTTPDLAGADVDVSRFVREGDDRGVHVFWRDFGHHPGDMEASTARELCPCPIGELRAFLGDARTGAWRWSLLERAWIPVRADELFPGLELLLRSAGGGYSVLRGWDPSAAGPVPPPVAAPDGKRECDRSDGDDPLSERACRSLRAHSDDTAREAKRLVEALPALDSDTAALVVRAARWHDLGKAHSIFQSTLRRSGCEDVPDLLAKSPGNARHERPGFRHELASALAALAHGESNLLAYLLAAHHGKVRLRIRSQPNEEGPNDGRLFARGIWDGDELPGVDLGAGELVPPTVLSLDYMVLGVSQRVGDSWTSRMAALRDDPLLGPFRLALLETLVRVADERASAKPGAGV
jgi:CRISPR-associated endonuclease/helicase Cas3